MRRKRRRHPPSKPKPTQAVPTAFIRDERTPITLPKKKSKPERSQKQKKPNQYPIRLHPPSKASPPTNLPIFSSSTSSNALELKISHILVAVFPICPPVFAANERLKPEMRVGCAVGESCRSSIWASSFLRALLM
jgi:hypothetical protein